MTSKTKDDANNDLNKIIKDLDIKKENFLIIDGLAF